MIDCCKSYLVQGDTTELKAVKVAKVFSSGVYGRTWPITAGVTRTARYLKSIETDVNIVACKNVSKQE